MELYTKQEKALQGCIQALERQASFWGTELFLYLRKWTSKTIKRGTKMINKKKITYNYYISKINNKIYEELKHNFYHKI